MSNDPHENLRTIYDKTAEHHKYFLSWRQYILAGSFAVTAALYYAAFALLDKGSVFFKWAALPLFANAILSIAFRYMDKRNRDLYRTCQNVGADIEVKLLAGTKPESKSDMNLALFHSLKESNKRDDATKISHSIIIDGLYIAICISSLVLGLIIYSTHAFNCCSCCH